MSEKKRDEKTIYINHKGELLIWLIVILLFVASSSLSFMHKSKNDENDYQIFIPDVDGLIVGSPVRMLGVEVGHIIKIKPVKDSMYVNFIITRPEVEIPQGSIITVEFSGMAGSKSLEIYPPDENSYVDKNTPIITVEQPKRLHDALYLLDDMYKKIGTIIYSFSSFGEKLNKANFKIIMPTDKKDNFDEFLKYSDEFLDNSTMKANEIKKNIEGFKKDAKQIR